MIFLGDGLIISNIIADLLWLKQCHKGTIPQENHHFYGWYKPSKMGWFIFVLTTMTIPIPTAVPSTIAITTVCIYYYYNFYCYY